MGWCQANHLVLNVTKTKEMVIDYKINKTDVSDLVIHGQTVERVEQYKYLGTIVDNKMNFKANAQSVYSKSRQRMHMLYQLRAFMVSSRTLERCYRAFVESVLTFSFTCWYGCLTVTEKKKLDSVVNECGKIVGVKQTSLAELYSTRVTERASRIRKDPSHVLEKYFELLPLERRLRTTKCRTNRFKFTFVPTAVSLLNSK